MNPPALSGTAMAVVNTGVFLGPTIFQPLVGWVLDRAGFQAALAVLAACRGGRARGRAPARAGDLVPERERRGRRGGAQPPEAAQRLTERELDEVAVRVPQHRDVADVAAALDGRLRQDPGRLALRRDRLELRAGGALEAEVVHAEVDRGLVEDQHELRDAGRAGSGREPGGVPGRPAVADDLQRAEAPVERDGAVEVGDLQDHVGEADGHVGSIARLAPAGKLPAGRASPG